MFLIEHVQVSYFFFETFKFKLDVFAGARHVISVALLIAGHGGPITVVRWLLGIDYLNIYFTAFK